MKGYIDPNAFLIIECIRLKCYCFEASTVLLMYIEIEPIALVYHVDPLFDRIPQAAKGDCDRSRHYNAALFIFPFLQKRIFNNNGSDFSAE